MRTPRPDPASRARSRWRTATTGTTAAVLLLAGLALGTGGAGTSAMAVSPAGKAVAFHGLRVVVPATWRIVDLRADPSACLRFDRSTIFLGHATGQERCPAHLLGGAPTLHLEALDRRAVEATSTTAIVTVPGQRALDDVPLAATGRTAIAVRAAGVLATAGYTTASTAVLREILASATVLAGARPVAHVPVRRTSAPQVAQEMPGSYRGLGFDSCAAPSQLTMNAWRSASPYASAGIYIGGVMMGCDQAYLTPSWVTHQFRAGWHLIPTYVGRQAPCSGFSARISYNRHTARKQGKAEGADAAENAHALGIADGSTLYDDMEGYDSSNPDCVTAVLSYLNGWTRGAHRAGFDSGVYSSASSGIHDLSTHYGSGEYKMPNDIWIAWWNGQANTDGGGYVPDSQWSHHQRVHQFVGNTYESYGGYRLLIDRDYLDLLTRVSTPKGCPSRISFHAYPYLRLGSHGKAVTAMQCQVAREGFDPGSADGSYDLDTGIAARGFKRWVGLSDEDASFGKWAWTALLTAGHTTFLHLGSHGHEVNKVQRALTARLQKRVRITGRYDDPTRRAVMTYQSLVGLDRTGTVGAPTWHALQTGE